MSCPTIRRFLFLICVAFFSLDSTNARPAILGRYSLYARQADGMGSPTTLVTVQTSQAVMGPMTQTCTIILTPITDGNGNQVVQEVKTCTLTTDVTGDSLGNGQAPFASPSSTAVSSSTTTAASDSCSSASTTASNATQSGPAVPATTTGTLPSYTAASTSTQSSAASPSATSTRTSVSNGSKAAATTSSQPSAAADVTTTPDSSFTLPGKQLSVLPVGLGVFAGISAITLVVVGLVTYERTKYRKAFRQRKLMEAGATMGYGGMAQRSP